MEDDLKLSLVKSIKQVLDNIFALELTDDDDNDDLKHCFKVLIFDEAVYDLFCPFLKVFN